MIGLNEVRAINNLRISHPLGSHFVGLNSLVQDFPPWVVLRPSQECPRPTCPFRLGIAANDSETLPSRSASDIFLLLAMFHLQHSDVGPSYETSIRNSLIDFLRMLGHDSGCRQNRRRSAEPSASKIARKEIPYPFSQTSSSGEL